MFELINKNLNEFSTAHEYVLLSMVELVADRISMKHPYWDKRTNSLKPILYYEFIDSGLMKKIE